MLDDDDKLRRNFVVACALIILAWWFDVSASTIINKFTTVDLKESHPLKTWAAVIVMLAYLTWRYAFCKDTLALWQDAIGALRRGTEHQVGQLVERHILRWFNDRKDSPIFRPVRISAYVTAWLQTKSEGAARVESTPIHKVHPGATRLPSTPWVGDSKMEITLDETSRGPVEIGGEAGPLRYVVPLHYRPWIWCRVGIKEVVLSERLTSWFAPAALGLSAWLITLAKTWAALAAAAGIGQNGAPGQWWSGGT